MGLVGAALAFLLGLQLGQSRSAVALRIVAVVALLMALWVRYEWATSHRATTLVMLLGAGSLVLISAALALVGPAVFKRWEFAICLSALLVFALHFMPVETTMCVVLGAC